MTDILSGYWPDLVKQPGDNTAMTTIFAPSANINMPTHACTHYYRCYITSVRLTSTRLMMAMMTIMKRKKMKWPFFKSGHFSSSSSKNHTLAVILERSMTHTTHWLSHLFFILFFLFCFALLTFHLSGVIYSEVATCWNLHYAYRDPYDWPWDSPPPCSPSHSGIALHHVAPPTLE